MFQINEVRVMSKEQAMCATASHINKMYRSFLKKHNNIRKLSNSVHFHQPLPFEDITSSDLQKGYVVMLEALLEEIKDELREVSSNE